MLDARRDPVPLNRVILDVAFDADFEAQARNRHVQVTQADDCIILGNRQLLRSAIENVIRNAVNYTPEGTAVQIALSKLSIHGLNTASITVRDHGSGVLEGIASRYFPAVLSQSMTHATVSPADQASAFPRPTAPFASMAVP